MNKKDKELKLFVWEEVLCVYTDGMMIALAPDVETARELLRVKMRTREYCYDERESEDDLQKAPQVYTTPIAFYIWGGSI